MKYLIAKFTIDCGAVSNSPITSESMQLARELIAALAGEAGFESFEDTKNGINGYVQQNLFNELMLRNYLSEFPVEGVSVSYIIDEAEDRNWNEEWESAGFEPIIISDKCVIHDSLHRSIYEHFPIDIEINAKQAFGTGTHNTTRMIVKSLIGMKLNNKSVLDCGCGTGILSIVAAKCGATKVTAYDIDEWSVENTKLNAGTNSVDNIDVRLGDATVLKNICGFYDVVVANINRNILLSDMKAMGKKMKSGGLFIISGFYKEDKPMLCERAENLKLKLVDEDIDENWCMLTFEHE